MTPTEYTQYRSSAFNEAPLLYGDNTCQCESIADHNNIDLPKEQLQVHEGTLEALPYSSQPPPPLALPWSPQLLLQLHTQTTTRLYVRVVCTEGACSICLQVDGDEGKLCISGDGGQGVGHCLSHSGGSVGSSTSSHWEHLLQSDMHK